MLRLRFWAARRVVRAIGAARAPLPASPGPFKGGSSGTGKETALNGP